MNQFSLRPAVFSDAALIAALTRASWAGRVAADSSGHTETSAQLETDLQHGQGLILLFQDQPVGSVRWQAISPVAGTEAEPAPIWELRRMGILPAQRGLGGSALLINAVLAAAQAAGVHEVRLAVRHDQPALLDFYARHDFQPARELEYRHANPTQPRPVVMRRRLR